MSEELTWGGGEREKGFTLQDKWQVLLSGLWKHPNGIAAPGRRFYSLL